MPLKVTKTKYKSDAVRNKVRLVCANQKCRGRRGAPSCRRWDIWEGGEGGVGSDHNENAPKRSMHDKILADTDSDDDVPLRANRYGPHYTMNRNAKPLQRGEESAKRHRQDGLSVASKYARTASGRTASTTRNGSGAERERRSRSIGLAASQRRSEREREEEKKSQGWHVAASQRRSEREREDKKDAGYYIYIYICICIYIYI